MASKKGIAITIAILVCVAVFAYSLPFLIAFDTEMKILFQILEIILILLKKEPRWSIQALMNHLKN